MRLCGSPDAGAKETPSQWPLRSVVMPRWSRCNHLVGPHSTPVQPATERSESRVSDAGSAFLVTERDFRQDSVDDRQHGKHCREKCGSCLRPKRFRNRVTGEVIRRPCRRRRCSYCGPHLWKPVRQALHWRGLEGVDPRALKVITLTAPGTDDLLGEWRQTFEGHAYPEDTHLGMAMAYFNDSAPGRFDHFMRLLRRATGIKWQHFKVAERQTRGATHYHGTLRAPDNKLHFIPMETFRRCAVEAGFGSRVELRAPRHVRSVAGYHGKAMAGASAHVAYQGKTVDYWEWRRQHAVTSSRDWAPTWVRRPRRQAASAAGWTYEERADFIRSLGADPEEFPPSSEVQLPGTWEYVNPPPRQQRRSAA